MKKMRFISFSTKIIIFGVFLIVCNKNEANAAFFDENGDLIEYLCVSESTDDGTAPVYYEYEFNDTGMLSKLTRVDMEYGSSTYTEFEYDSLENNIRKITYNGDEDAISWYEFEYDIEGNQIIYTVCDGEGNRCAWTEYEYDWVGNITRADSYYIFEDEIISDGYSLYEYYNDDSILSFFQYDVEGNITSGYTNDYTYMEDGYKTSYYAADGTDAGYYSVTVLDSSGNIIQVEHFTEEGLVTATDVYTYDSDGNRIYYGTYNSDGVRSGGATYEYDDYGNMVTKKTVTGSIEALTIYEYMTVWEYLYGADEGSSANYQKTSSGNTMKHISLANAFGSEHDAESILTVTFLDTLDTVPYGETKIWDASEEGDNSVLTWLEVAEDVDTSILYDYDGEVEAFYNVYIAGDGGVDASTDTSALFARLNNLVSIDFGNCFYTHGCTDMDNMFLFCNSVRELDLSGFDTSSVTDMSYMFFDCTSLTSIDVSSFDTSNVTDMRYMFYNCIYLPSLDLSNFETENVKDFSGMFAMCVSLRELNISNFYISDSSWSVFMYWVTIWDEHFQEKYYQEDEASGGDTEIEVVTTRNETNPNLLTSYVVASYPDGNSKVIDFTGEYESTENPIVYCIGVKDGIGYCYRYGIIMAYDLANSGEILWQNLILQGDSSGASMGEDAIYITEKTGPELYVMSFSGEEIYKIDDFGIEGFYPYDISVYEDVAVIYFGTDDTDEVAVVYVDLETWEYYQLPMDDISRVVSVEAEYGLDSSQECAVIYAYDSAGNVIWSYETDWYYMAVSSCLGEICQTEDNYYFCENGTVINFNKHDGSIVWENSDWGGNKASKYIIDEEGYLYLCGYVEESPFIFIISPDGDTVSRVNLYEIEGGVRRMKVLGGELEVSVEDYTNGGTVYFYIDLSDFSYTQEITFDEVEDMDYITVEVTDRYGVYLETDADTDISAEHFFIPTGTELTVMYLTENSIGEDMGYVMFGGRSGLVPMSSVTEVVQEDAQ